MLSQVLVPKVCDIETFVILKPSIYCEDIWDNICVLAGQIKIWVNAFDSLNTSTVVQHFWECLCSRIVEKLSKSHIKCMISNATQTYVLCNSEPTSLADLVLWLISRCIATLVLGIHISWWSWIFYSRDKAYTNDIKIYSNSYENIVIWITMVTTACAAVTDET